MNEMKTKNGTILPLANLKGKPYLMVAHRIVWFREECPNHTILTEFVQLTESYAIAKATIKHGELILATSHKREDQKHFPDFMEKAETGAVGRALALIGYGTQFAPEFDEGDRIVDTPIKAAEGKHSQGQTVVVNKIPQPEANDYQKVEKEKIKKELLAVGWSKTELISFMSATYNIQAFDQLTLTQAKDMLLVVKDMSFKDWFERSPK